MELNLASLEQRVDLKKVKSDWRTFEFHGQKVRLKIKNINNDAYRIAQDRLVEQLRATMHNLTVIESIDETQFAKQMKIVAYHLVSDWDGMFDKKSGLEIEFTHENMYVVMTYGGDIGISLHSWILIQATDIQNILDRELDRSVGKPFSFTDSLEKTSAENATEKSEQS